MQKIVHKLNSVLESLPGLGKPGLVDNWYEAQDCGYNTLTQQACKAHQLASPVLPHKPHVVVKHNVVESCLTVVVHVVHCHAIVVKHL